jgi:hypothetical protein
MATLIASGTNFGEVLSSDKDQEFPCMDTNYRELKWQFTVLKQFSNFSALISFEKSTLPNYFSNREKSVTYKGDTEDDCILQTIKRKSVAYAGSPCYAEYEVVFTKEG